MPTKKIEAWSFSRLKKYEQCPYAAYLEYIEKIPEPERPELEDGKEYPNDRGSRVHDEAELYVRGQGELPIEAATFAKELEFLRKHYAEDSKRLELEQMWLFNKGWRPLSDRARKPWLRVKLDVLFWISEVEVVSIDYKTGKRFNNEIKHAEQLQLYQLATLMRYPQVQTVHTELWYFDIDHIESMSFTRSQGERFLKGYNDRALHMTTAEVFPARPSNHACFFCPYKTGKIGKLGPMGTGHCNRNP